MDDFLNDFEQLKISAFSKVQAIKDNVKSVTIGPESLQNSKGEVDDKEEKNSKGENDKKNVIYAVRTKHIYPYRQVMKELDNERKEKVKYAIGARISKIEEFSKIQENVKKQILLQKQQAFINDLQQKDLMILKELQQYDANKANEHAKLIKNHHDFAERQKKYEQDKEQRRLILSANIDKIDNYQTEFRNAYQEIITIIKTCTSNEDLKNMLGESFKQLKTLPDGIQGIVARCKSFSISEEDVKKAANFVVQVKILKEKIEDSVNEINKKNEIKTQPTATDSGKQPAQVEKLPTDVESKQQSKEVPPKDKITKSESANLNLTEFVSLNNFKIYTEVMDFLESHVESFRTLLDDNNLKQFRFDCKKAVNIPVNAISAVSAVHLLDKYNKLYKLLAGHTVYIADKPINATKHPQGIAFCLDLLAKKFVLQGDLMISSNPESAFGYATIIISLWNDFPVLGKLLLAYFYKACPYLVPYYIPRNVGESDEEYYIKQGYQYNNNQIEKQDKFLKRMTGIMRLYSALLISKPKKGQNNIPHKIDNGWRWLASILKLEPRVDITATMLHTFLETSGFQMEASYGNMFKKLMKITIDKFLPSCREKCTGGAVTRLELLLSEYVKNGKFDSPSGYVSHPYW